MALSFIFTTCSTVCPVLSATLAGLRRALGSTAADLRMVSISIDPEHDRPMVLKSYAARYHAGPDDFASAAELADELRETLAEK